MKEKTRYRILWPRPEEKRDITHWVFAADPKKHKPIFYGCAHFAFYSNGRAIEGYQLHHEF